LRKSRPNPESGSRPLFILVIRLSAIGDVLLATPLLRMMKRARPDCRVDFLVKNAYVSLLESNQHVDRIFELDTRSGWKGMLSLARTIRNERYDAVVDLQGNVRSRFLSLFSGAPVRTRARMNRVKRFLLVHLKRNFYGKTLPVPFRFLKAAPFPVQDDGLGLDLSVPELIQSRIGRKLGKTGARQRGRVAMAPGAGRFTKQWPADRYAEVGNALAAKGYDLILLGGKQDATACAAVVRGMRTAPLDLSGKLSLLETAAALRLCDLLITGDTGVMHLASALHTKTIALFGPTTRHFGFAPFRTRAVVIEKTLDCRPCSYHGTLRCPKKHFRCMLGISPRKVADRATDLLHSR